MTENSSVNDTERQRLVNELQGEIKVLREQSEQNENLMMKVNAELKMKLEEIKEMSKYISEVQG